MHTRADIISRMHTRADIINGIFHLGVAGSRSG
jgi:hypothetical protein